jgi:hypothetical protein
MNGKNIPRGKLKLLSEVASRAEGWRFVIEDPYEDHDLGRVVREPRGQQLVCLISFPRGCYCPLTRCCQ